jgi:hypothetical protein
MKVANGDVGSQDGGDCDVPHRLDMRMRMCLYVYSHPS